MSVDDISLDGLLQRNRRWAARKRGFDADFFQRLVDQQQPAYFWIGCSDSRVPATEIVDLDPGEMFVHRNVANLAVAGDPSLEAALDFALHDLRVRHVIVVGHYGCGGVRAACEGRAEDSVGRWLQGPRVLVHRHGLELSALAPRAREDRLCELNVLDQVNRLRAHRSVVSVWRAGRALSLHGWVYSIADGLIARLCEPVSAPR